MATTNSTTNTATKSAKTTSFAFPNMLNVTGNNISILTDNASIVNRTRLLILSEPTSLYNSPEFGVGLKRHLWQYNNENQKAIIKDRIVKQLRLNEPCVLPEKTQFADGLLFTGNDTGSINQDYNHLKMTISLATKYEDTVEVELNDSVE